MKGKNEYLAKIILSKVKWVWMINKRKLVQENISKLPPFSVKTNKHKLPIIWNWSSLAKFSPSINPRLFKSYVK